jgi:hypothetical protein
MFKFISKLFRYKHEKLTRPKEGGLFTLMRSNEHPDPCLILANSDGSNLCISVSPKKKFGTKLLANEAKVTYNKNYQLKKQYSNADYIPLQLNTQQVKNITSIPSSSYDTKYNYHKKNTLKILIGVFEQHANKRISEKHYKKTVLGTTSANKLFNSEFAKQQKVQTAVNINDRTLALNILETGWTRKLRFGKNKYLSDKLTAEDLLKLVKQFKDDEKVMQEIFKKRGIFGGRDFWKLLKTDKHFKELAKYVDGKNA